MEDRKKGTGQFSFFTIYFHSILEDYICDNAILDIKE